VEERERIIQNMTGKERGADGDGNEDIDRKEDGKQKGGK
jgi:hypothetical protein